MNRDVIQVPKFYARARGLSRVRSHTRTDDASESFFGKGRVFNRAGGVKR